MFVTEEKVKELYDMPLSECACDMCQFETTKLHLTVAPRESERSSPILLCDICHCTFAGNAFIYPSQYKPEFKVMQMLAYCTNRILSESRSSVVPIHNEGACNHLEQSFEVFRKVNEDILTDPCSEEYDETVKIVDNYCAIRCFITLARNHSDDNVSKVFDEQSARFWNNDARDAVACFLEQHNNFIEGGMFDNEGDNL